MAFRLSMSEAPDLTTIQVAGRLGDDAVALLGDACGGVRRPLAVDLSELTSASDAGVLLLRRLAGEGVQLLGGSHYVRLLLEPATAAHGATGSRRPPSPRPPGESPAPGRGRRRR